MVHGTVLLVKPAVKCTAKWLLCSLQGFPKCAMTEGVFASHIVYQSPHCTNTQQQFHVVEHYFYSFLIWSAWHVRENPLSCKKFSSFLHLELVGAQSPLSLCSQELPTFSYFLFKFSMYLFLYRQ